MSELERLRAMAIALREGVYSCKECGHPHVLCELDPENVEALEGLRALYELARGKPTPKKVRP